jgi:hypothetical protein
MLRQVWQTSLADGGSEAATQGAFGGKKQIKELIEGRHNPRFADSNSEGPANQLTVENQLVKCKASTSSNKVVQEMFRNA